jgi:hypothetical protein
MLYPAELRVRRGECIARVFGTRTGNGVAGESWLGGHGAVDVGDSEKISEATADYDSQTRLDAIQCRIAAL